MTSAPWPWFTLGLAGEGGPGGQVGCGREHREDLGEHREGLGEHEEGMGEHREVVVWSPCLLVQKERGESGS